MQIWNTKTTQEILKSLNAEIAKAQNEIKCAQGDLDKAQGRLQFTLSAVKHLLDKDIKE
jgi:hypothetical protein